MASITVVSGAGRGETHRLECGDQIIGRDGAASVRVMDAMVSRRHARLRWHEPDRQFHLADLQSANGTMVNGRRVVHDIILRDGDLIEIGESQLVYTTDDRVEDILRRYVPAEGAAGKAAATDDSTAEHQRVAGIEVEREEP